MYLFIDTETGGLNPKECSLLEFYGRVVDEELECVDEIHLYPKPYPYGYYKISPEALRVNKFVPPLDLDSFCTDKLITFLHTHGAKQRLTPVGWNVHFDLAFGKEHIPVAAWNTCVSYRAMDLQAVAQFILGTTVKNFKLETVGQYFNLINAQEHNARSDVLLCIEVMKKLRQYVK